jgi:DNA-binding HxlR family transcriptional regulator
MPGISSKMLTERLRILEETEIISRHQQHTVPPQVFDELTKEGRELTTILDQSIRWRIVGKPAISTGNQKTAKRQDKGQAYTI